MITLKLPYYSRNNEDKEKIHSYIKNFNNVLRFTYNRICDSQDRKLSTKELTALQKNMNHVFLDSHFKNSAIYKAREIYNRNKDKKVIFGGKKLLKQREEEKIEKGEFAQKRNLPLFSVGEAPQKGNRKFQIISENLILFKPSRQDHFYLTLPNLRKNYKKKILKLLELQNSKSIPITYELNDSHIFISYEEESLQNEKFIIKDRIFAIDSNPNYLGWSVVDWKNEDDFKIVSSGVISIKKINDNDNSLKNKGLDSSSKERKYISNKRRFETVEIAAHLASLASHFRCELFVAENLSIEPSNKGRGKKYNRLVNNQWCRNLLFKQIEKRCKIAGINYYTVNAAYSSFVGNLAYRELNLPDMILSSIEIGRRGFEWHHQFIKKDKERKKNIIFNESEKNLNLIRKSLEELNYKNPIRSIENLYKEIKTLNLRYRVSLNENLKFFSLKSNKSKVESYIYI